MKEFLNNMFGPKGLEFLDIIVTEVLLPDDIKMPLDMKAQFGSLNEMEREKYNYDMRLINDEEELELLRQRKYEERDSIDEDFAQKITLTRRELEITHANAKKSVAEINAQSKAEQAQIKADADLKNEQIKGETFVTKTIEETKGSAEAEMVLVEAKNECNKAIAQKMLEVADLKAQTLQVIGEGEKQIADVMNARRKYEVLNSKLEVIESFKHNKNLKVFGNNKDDVLTQVAAFRVNQGGGI